MHNIKKIIYFLILIFFVPIFIIYLFFCFTIPLFKLGKTKKGKDITFYVCKDLIHSDYVFESNLFEDVFGKKNKFIKIGWGDRKIFLETKSWKELKIKDFLFAFFGLNRSVLRIDFLNELPKNCTCLTISNQQFEVVKNHILHSFDNQIIEKKPEYYQLGCFYQSNLKYNCVTNCNNWVNAGLLKAKISNRLWCPLSFWL